MSSRPRTSSRTPPLVNTTDLLSQICVQQLVVSNFAKNRENVRGEFCLNVIYSQERGLQAVVRRLEAVVRSAYVL